MAQKHHHEASVVPRRWAVSPGMRVWIAGHNRSAKRVTAKHLTGTVRPPTGPVELAFVTPQTVEEAVHFATKVRPRLAGNAAIWIIQPKPDSARRYEFDGDAAELVRRLVEQDFVHVDTMSVDNDYCSSCFRVAGD